MNIEINNDIDIVVRCYHCDNVMEIDSITNRQGEIVVEVYKCDECTKDDLVTVI